MRTGQIGRWSVLVKILQVTCLIYKNCNLLTPVSSLIHTFDYDSPRGPRFTVFASLRTNAYEAMVWPTFDASDARSLSQSLIAQNRLFTHDLREAHAAKVWGGAGGFLSLSVAA